MRKAVWGSVVVLMAIMLAGCGDGLDTGLSPTSTSSTELKAQPFSVDNIVWGSQTAPAGSAEE